MRNIFHLHFPAAATAALCFTGSIATASHAESPDFWVEQGERAIQHAKDLKPKDARAKNVILFVGDGMGISTITAARILEGQMIKGSAWGGEENALSFETLPYLALSKTYSVNQQTPDSAPTMTAMVTGVKTNDGVLSVNENIVRREARWSEIQANKLTTILELAEMKGLSTGVVSTARITHATPAACYAHTSERDWENDANVAAGSDVKDIARQLIEFPYGDGLEVAMGGGRGNFLPRTVSDPEIAGRTGSRNDGRNLAAEWAGRAGAAYVWNKSQFDSIDPYATSHLLGLFESSHMQYEADRSSDIGGEPSLTEMTEKAIQILGKNRKGFFLHVEAGRIDHGHHAGNAYRALGDTIEFSNAIRKAMEMTDPRETLIVVTADHSHVLTIAGYPKRGNPILGKVVQPGNTGYTNAADGKPYTTLSYANGPGFHVLPIGGDTVYSTPIAAGRSPVDLATVDTESQGYHQEALIPLGSETHAGEDVAIFAGGPSAHLFHGVQEQSYIYYVLSEALGLDKHRKHKWH